MYSLIIKKSIFPVLASAVFIFFALATDVYANPNKAKTLFISAQVAYENKQYDDAIQALKAVKKALGNSNARISALEIKIYLEQNEFGQAKQSLEDFYSHNATENLLKEMSPYIIKVENYFLEIDDQFDAIKGLTALKKFLKKYPFQQYREKASSRYYLTDVQQIKTTKILAGTPDFYKEGSNHVKWKYDNRGDVIQKFGDGYSFAYENKYDNEGYLIEERSFELDSNKAKKLMSKNEYSYDKKGRLLENLSEWFGPVPSKKQISYLYDGDKIIKRIEKNIDVKFSNEYRYEHFDNGDYKVSLYEKHWKENEPVFLSNYSIHNSEGALIQFAGIDNEKFFDGEIQYITESYEYTFNQYGDITSKKMTSYKEGNKNNPEWIVIENWEYKYEKKKFNFL